MQVKTATVRNGHRTTHRFQVRKAVSRLYILTLLIYAEFLMRNAGLDEVKAEVNIAKRNISNLRYEDDITLMAESEKE